MTSSSTSSSWLESGQIGGGGGGGTRVSEIEFSLGSCFWFECVSGVDRVQAEEGGRKTKIRQSNVRENEKEKGDL